MKRILLALVTAGLTIAATAHTDTAAQWQKRYTAIGQTVDRRDMKAFFAYLSPNFVDVDQNGKESKLAQYKVGMTQMMSSAKAAKSIVKVTGVKQSGSTTLINYSWKLKMTFSAPQGNSVLNADETGIDSWEQVKGKWLQTKSVTKTLVQKVTKAPNG